MTSCWMTMWATQFALDRWTIDISKHYHGLRTFTVQRSSLRLTLTCICTHPSWWSVINSSWLWVPLEFVYRWWYFRDHSKNEYQSSFQSREKCTMLQFIVFILTFARPSLSALLGVWWASALKHRCLWGIIRVWWKNRIDWMKCIVVCWARPKRNEVTLVVDGENYGWKLKVDGANSLWLVCNIRFPWKPTRKDETKKSPNVYAENKTFIFRLFIVSLLNSISMQPF